MEEFWLLGQPYWVGVLVGAFIAFGATFGGVFTSFCLENRRRRREERNTFGRLIESVVMESALNKAVLNEIEHTALEEDITTWHIKMDALLIALHHPLTFTYAPFSFILAMQHIFANLSDLNNVLEIQRRDRSFTGDSVRVLNDRANTCRKLIDILESEIEPLRPQFGVQMRRDERLQAVS